MIVKKHPSTRCPVCGDALYYGLKPEPTGWKVQYSCPPPTGCGREFSAGWVTRESGIDDCEPYKRAKEIGREVGN